jgi:hypothetical protein
MATKYRNVAGYIYRESTGRASSAVAYVTTPAMTRRIVRLLNADAKAKPRRVKR